MANFVLVRVTRCNLTPRQDDYEFYFKDYFKGEMQSNNSWFQQKCGCGCGGPVSWFYMTLIFGMTAGIEEHDA